ncbi:uncharacterized protein LOC128723501 [Anopheles nili]|uniref:uncharacterized protein LOC128723501 n=1 Tax=Anopheles nili TaxID=185578 RepID=UPI00237A7BD4|nr:uncharacterized protein LOC128723501 [Anopheles nili]
MPISAPKIPEGLPELMRGLAKSVIKENPENLYVHAAEYFENLIRERDGQLGLGYQAFDAYQVYADHKERTREKLGLTKDPSLSDGIGGDGDESGSGGSESKSRGRKRRRARKPSSREKDIPLTMVGKPPSSEDGDAGKPVMSLSDESVPVPVVEQEIVKVHYNPPEAPPTPARVVSAQSMEAEQAVSSVLEDDQILDSEGTGGKETGDELADNGDEIGTAPSTAEITEQSRAVISEAELNEAMALQDMETCFMHANVDDILEKGPEEPMVVNEEPETRAKGAKSPNALEGEDIPEGPETVEAPGVNVAADNGIAIREDDPEKSVGDSGLPDDAIPSEKVADITPERDLTPTAPEEANVDTAATTASLEEQATEDVSKPSEEVNEAGAEIAEASDTKVDEVSEELQEMGTKGELKEAAVDESSIEGPPAEELLKPVTKLDNESSEDQPQLEETVEPVITPVAVEDSEEQSVSTETQRPVIQEVVEGVNESTSAAEGENAKILAATVSPEAANQDEETASADRDDRNESDGTIVPEPVIDQQDALIEKAAEDSPSQQAEEPLVIASRLGNDEEQVVDETETSALPTNSGSDPVEEAVAIVESPLGTARQVTEESEPEPAQNEPEPTNEDEGDADTNKAEIETIAKNNETIEDAPQENAIKSNDDAIANSQEKPTDEDVATADNGVVNSGSDTSSPESTSAEKNEHVEPANANDVEQDIKNPSIDEDPETKVKNVTGSKEETPEAEAVDGEKGVADPPIDSPVPEAERNIASPESLEKQNLSESKDDATVPDAESSQALPDQPFTPESEQLADESKEQQESGHEKTVDFEAVSDEKEAGEAQVDHQRSNDGEVIKDETVKDGDDLLTKARSLEDSVLADGTVVVPEQVVSGEPNGEEKIPETVGGDSAAEGAVSSQGGVQEAASQDATAKEPEQEQSSVDETQPADDAEKTEEGTIANATDDGENVNSEGQVEEIKSKSLELLDEQPALNSASSEPALNSEEKVEDKQGDEKRSESLKDVDETQDQSPARDTATSAAESLADGEAEAKDSNEVVVERTDGKDVEDTPEEDKLKDKGTSIYEEASPEKPADDEQHVTDVVEAETKEPVAQDTSNSEGADMPVTDAPEGADSPKEVVEEPCVKRVVTPSKTGRLERADSSDKQVEELEEIKKVDLSQLSKNSAEALFYSLKKSELENQDPADAVEPEEAKGMIDPEPEEAKGMIDPEPERQDTVEGDGDDDKDVVVKEEPHPIQGAESPKRGFTDDFLDETPITEVAPMASDGVEQEPQRDAPVESSVLEASERQDEFNPMVMVSMRSKQFQEQLHGRAVARDTDQADTQDMQTEDCTPKRPTMRRCMTEMSGLQRFDTLAIEDEPVDPDYVEEEDQFDGYYIGHIKNKILASSVSVADSDCYDAARSSVESVDENNVRTALETIASTDTESTIASQATIQQAAGRRSYLRKHSQNASSNIPYASFGNAAIDRSLDEFIEREERHKQDEALAEAATKIQRSYRTHKKKLLRDYHSTMRTFTEDQSAESGEETAANVIQIKLDQRRTPGGIAEETTPVEGDVGAESDSTMATLPVGPGKRPMYSLNIDEYDTVARRMTLTRGVAMQRNSTPEDDSGKSANVSTDRKPSLGGAPVAPETQPTSGSGDAPSGPERSSSDSSEERPAAVGPTGSSSDERDTKDATRSSSRSKPLSTGRTTYAQLDVQNLLLIARQRTMPVQIDSSVIRVLPKHMRKRISSAGMLPGNGKRK